MSVGLGYSATVNQAVTNSIASGVPYAVAAGNNAADACTYSPGTISPALTVAATDKNDVFASFSNGGNCVDLEAPGVAITSAWIGSATATQTLSGTSMAAPHVAGAAALYLATKPAATVNDVMVALINNATPVVVTSLPVGTKSQLLYTDSWAHGLPGFQWAPHGPGLRWGRSTAACLLLAG